MVKEIDAKMKDAELVLPLRLSSLSLQMLLRIHLGKSTFRAHKN